MALVGIALGGAIKKDGHNVPRAFLDEPAAILQEASAAFNSSRAANTIPGMYLVEFADGHVGSRPPKTPAIVADHGQGQY